MKVFVADQTKKEKFIGETPNISVPRIGEKVWLGYNPPPVVTDVIYIFEEDSVFVCIDGFILQ